MFLDLTVAKRVSPDNLYPYINLLRKEALITRICTVSMQDLVHERPHWSAFLYMRIEIESFFGDVILFSPNIIEIKTIKNRFYELVSSYKNVDLRDKVLSMLVDEFHFKIENKKSTSKDIVATIDTDINHFFQHKC